MTSACVCSGSTGDESAFQHVLGTSAATWPEQLLQQHPVAHFCPAAGNRGRSRHRRVVGLWSDPEPWLQVTVPLPGSQLSLANFGSGGGQPLLAMPPTPPQAQPPNISRQPPVSQAYRGIMGPSHNMMQPPSSKVLWARGEGTRTLSHRDPWFVSCARRRWTWT